MNEARPQRRSRRVAAVMVLLMGIGLLLPLVQNQTAATILAGASFIAAGLYIACRIP